MNSRRAGGEVYIELFLEFDPAEKMSSVQTTIDRMKKSLESKIENSRVVVAPVSAPVA